MEKVKVIAPGHKTIAGSLGITDERHSELSRVMLAAMESIPDAVYAEILEAVSYECRHPNELAMMAFDLGRVRIASEWSGVSAPETYRTAFEKGEVKLSAK